MSLARSARSECRSTSSTVQVLLDRVAEPVEEVRVAHRPQREVHSRVQQHRGCCAACRSCRLLRYWQASQASGFSIEQARASSSGADAASRRSTCRRRPRRWPAGSAWPGGTAGSRWSSARPSRRRGTSRRACRSWARPGTGSVTGSGRRRGRGPPRRRSGLAAAAPRRSGRGPERPAAGLSIPWTEPSAFLISVRIASVQRPRALSSRTRAVLICRNSPERVSRLKRLETCGSMHS